MFAFGYIAGMAVLNGWIQARSGLPLDQFGLVLATGALAALAVNLYLRRSGKRYSGEFGLLLLSVAVWLPVLAQSLPALMLAYSLQGAASRIALAGLYRAITEVQRRSESLGAQSNPTLVLESMAGFGLGLSFFLNSQLTGNLGIGWPSALLAMGFGVATAIVLRGKLPDWQGSAARAAASGEASPALLFAFAVYCTEVFTMTQATAWSSILTQEFTLASRTLSPLLAGGLLTGIFWLVVGVVRWSVGQAPWLDLRKVVIGGCLLCAIAVVLTLSNPRRAAVLIPSYALLGAGIACFVPFALQTIAIQPNAGRLAERLALLGPVMSVGVHVITGYFAAWREYFVLAALSVSLLLAWSTKGRPRWRSDASAPRERDFTTGPSQALPRQVFRREREDQGGEAPKSSALLQYDVRVSEKKSPPGNECRRGP